MPPNSRTSMNQLDFVHLWKVLADTKRRRIINLLAEKTRTTSEISAHFNVSRFAVMRHLKVLEQAQLIKTRREGRQRWNFLNEELFQQIQRTYLENGTDGEYQLNDVLGFLVRQDGGWPRETDVSEQPSIKQSVSLQAGSDRVFRALTEDVDGWWSYRVTADSHIYLEAQVGGRFYEAFNGGGGGGALYALVTYLKPGEEFRLNGSMGLADQTVVNIVHIVLTPRRQEETRLELTHSFVGKVSPITVETFKQSWDELLNQHLKAFVEQGTRFQPDSKEAT
jgi:DNA-binding transcriptional ArsR family regulator